MADLYDVIVVGGGPAGATAATDLSRRGLSVALLDRAGRIKPCGGAIPPRLIRDFDLPDHLLAAKIRSARVYAPSKRSVHMPIEGGFVGMVDREVFDEWLRERARSAGATRIEGTFETLTREPEGTVRIDYRAKLPASGEAATASIRARIVVGADGARSAVARQSVPGAHDSKCVFAYHEIVSAPARGEVAAYEPTCCDIHYRGDLSPDFYGWIFPHGATASIGVGSARKGFELRRATERLRAAAGLEGTTTIRREGAPIPMAPLRKWDDGRNVVLAGDAAGVVAPASGEGIYYAMLGGRLAADAAADAIATGQARHLATARRRFMSAHGRVFWVLGMMQHFWYRNDKRRERFVSMCADPDVQRLTWQSYMNKELVRADPLAHVRIFFKDLAHLTGLVRP